MNYIFSLCKLCLKINYNKHNLRQSSVSYSGGTQLDAVQVHFYLRHKIRLNFRLKSSRLPRQHRQHLCQKMTKNTDIGILMLRVFQVNGISLTSVAALKEFDLRKGKVK